MHLLLCNGCVQVLGCTKQLVLWGDQLGTFHDLAVKDGRITDLTASIVSSEDVAPAAVAGYLRRFDQFAFLWEKDLTTEYEAFISSHPNLDVIILCQAHSFFLCFRAWL